MAGQLWVKNEIGGFMYSDELSDYLRCAVQPLVKFRQFADAKDASDKGLHSGSKFYWNVYQDISTQGHTIKETETMPESNFKITQQDLTIEEYGNSVPYTGLLDNFSKHPVIEIINKVLKNDAKKAFDISVFTEFNKTPLRVVPTSGTATDSVVLTDDGTPAETNDVEMGKDHVKAIVDEMKERNIPAYEGDDYFALSHPTTYRNFKNDLEDIHQHTPEGFGLIMNGEIGRYESVRFVEQTHIPKGGAADSTSFDALTNTGDPWDNGKSSWAFFFGEDTVAEAVAIPEEVRGKIPEDYGRSRGVAWYALLGYGLVHENDAKQARIVKWDSAE